MATALRCCSERMCSSRRQQEPLWSQQYSQQVLVAANSCGSSYMHTAAQRQQRTACAELVQAVLGLIVFAHPRGRRLATHPSTAFISCAFLHCFGASCSLSHIFATTEQVTATAQSGQHVICCTPCVMDACLASSSAFMLFKRNPLPPQAAELPSDAVRGRTRVCAARVHDGVPAAPGACALQPAGAVAGLHHHDGQGLLLQVRPGAVCWVLCLVMLPYATKHVR